MPVRFQVDPDFYDHPKTIGMSDSATALWARAGSYSVAKLLDGFVPEHALSLLSTVPGEAASELVGRRLWRRVKGGFRFHEWDQRNLTRARVEADREQWREQKRRQRASGKDAQLNGHNVQGGHQGGHQPDSGESPDMSVSVSTSVSTSKRKPSSSAKLTDTDPDWSAFWDSYPRKVGKGQARKAWKTALTKAAPADIIAGAQRYRDDPGRDPKFTAHPSTWLNGERWTDQAAVARPATDAATGWWDN